MRVHKTLLVSIFLVTPFLRAQEQEPQKTSDEAHRLEEAMPGWIKVFDAAEDARKAIETNQTAITEARAKLATEVPEAAQPFAEFTSRDGEQLAAAAARAVERHLAFTTQADGRAKLIEALGKTKELANARTSSLQALVNALEDAEPLLIAVQRQITSGALEASALSLPEGQTLDVWVTRAQTIPQEASSRFEALAKRAADATEELKRLAEARATSLEAATARMQADLYQAFSAALQGAASAREELSKGDPTTLASNVQRLAQQREGEARTLQQTAEEAGAALSALKAVDGELEAARPPALDEFSGGEGHAELVDARKRLEHARATEAFLTERLSRTQEMVTRITAAAEKVEAELQARESLLATSERLHAALDLAAAWKQEGTIEDAPVLEGVTTDTLWLQFKDLVVAQDGSRTTRGVLATRRDDSGPEKVETLTKTLQEQKDEVARLAGTVEEELTYAEVIKTTETLGNDDLTALLAPEGEIAKNLESLEAQVKEARVAWEAKEVELLRQRKAVQEIENPYTMAVINRTNGEERVGHIEKTLDSTELVFPPDPALLDPDGRKIAAEKKAPPAESQGEVSEAELTKQLRVGLQVKQTKARALVQYFQELEEGVERLRAIGEERNAAHAGYAEVMSKWILEAKRRYACSVEFLRRLAAGRAQEVATPSRENLDDWAKRDRVRSLETRRDQVLDRQRKVRTRTEDELVRLDRILAWNPWAKMRSSQSDQLVILIGQPEVHLVAAEKAIDELSDVEKKTLRYEAQDRKAEELGTWTGILVSFTGAAERARFDEPLDAYYLEREFVRNRAAEYGKAHDSYVQLIEQSEVLRGELAEGLENLKEGVNQRRTDYHVARYLLSIAKNPAKRPAIEADYQATVGKPLPIPLEFDERIALVEDWINHLSTAEVRLRGRQDWAQELTFQLSKYGIEADIGRYRSHMARIASQVDVQKGIDEALTKRIDTLREDFAQTIRSNALRTLFEILIIPFVAILFVRLFRRVFTRLEKRHMDRHGENDPDRQRRMKTLTDASSAAVKVLVWTLAIIYLLGRLGLDITPIVASASVLGLAVAFGAQALIKDYFYGFFILLENQYTLGDIVDLGGCAGTVERISLRVTVLRDVQGTVHYVPNGTINRVSNKTQGWSQVVLEVGVSYGSDIDHVTKVLEDELALLHQEDTMGLTFIDKPQVLGVETLGESSVDLRVVAKVRPGKQWATAREIRKRVKRRFDREGIEIPFPQRVIHTLHAPSTES